MGRLMWAPKSKICRGGSRIFKLHCFPIDRVISYNSALNGNMQFMFTKSDLNLDFTRFIQFRLCFSHDLVSGNTILSTPSCSGIINDIIHYWREDSCLATFLSSDFCQALLKTFSDRNIIDWGLPPYIILSPINEISARSCFRNGRQLHTLWARTKYVNINVQNHLWVFSMPYAQVWAKCGNPAIPHSDWGDGSWQGEVKASELITHVLLFTS